MNQKDFFELADEMEKECGDWENSEGLSEKTLSELIAKVEAMDREESAKKAAESGTVKCFRLKKRYLVVLAATLVLLFGMGVVGDRVWIADSEDMERRSEVTTKVNNEEKESVLLEEEVIYQEIAEKLGIAPMRLGYFPEGMVLDSYMLMESTGWVNVFYQYNDKTISIKMSKHMGETSSNVQWDGKYRKLENISNSYGYEELIEAYCIDEANQNYTANITYGNGYYSISGLFEENEFVEILNGIYFKSL